MKQYIYKTALIQALKKEFDKTRITVPSKFFGDQPSSFGMNWRGAIRRAMRIVEQMGTDDMVVHCMECSRWHDPIRCPMCHEEYTYDEDDGCDSYTVDYTPDDGKGFCYAGERYRE